MNDDGMSDAYYDAPDDEPEEVEESDPDDENERRAEWARMDEEWSRKFNNGTWATQ